MRIRRRMRVFFWDELYSRIFSQTINSIIKSKSLFHLVVWLTMSRNWGNDANGENCFEIWLCFCCVRCATKEKYVPSVSNFFPTFLNTLSLVKRILCFFVIQCGSNGIFHPVFHWKMWNGKLFRKQILLQRREVFAFVFFSPYFLKAYCVSFSPSYAPPNCCLKDFHLILSK